MRLFKPSKISWESTERPVRSQLEESLLAEGFDPFAWVDEPGKIYKPHSHEHDEVIWIIRGSMEFLAAGESFDLGPGDRLILPRGSMHEAFAGPDGCEYLVGQRH